MDKKELLAYCNEIEKIIEDASDFIWSNPEVSGHEKNSADYYRKELQKNGFKVVNIESMDHAFYAEYGSGAPVIAILAEYDALPGLSQSISTEYNPIENQESGHGCGHNLLGAAAFGGALAAKKLLETFKKSGTIRFYGCPEEELLVGKVKMIAQNAFDGCDIALSWHPMVVNAAVDEAFLAFESLKFEFEGISSHAGQSPESGRSALDAVELMNVGANYLREHVVDRARIHYTITNAGGAPNIIPKYAESWYNVRCSRKDEVEDIVARLIKVAQGAAMMTETSVKVKYLGGSYEYLTNTVLCDLTEKNMREVDLPIYSKEEIEFAASIQKTLDRKMIDTDSRKYQILSNEKAIMYNGVMDRNISEKIDIAGSSDSGDVSWIMPMNLFITACWPIGVVNHSWQTTASAGASIGKKGMMYAVRIFSGMLYDLFNNPEIVKEAQEEFSERTAEFKYKGSLGTDYIKL